MKKIFAISFLSVFAVVGVARAEYYGYYASGTLANQNYNLASVNYVDGSYDSAVDTAKGLVVKSDKKTTVAGGSRSSGFAGSDEKAPTIKYMEDSIAEAVDNNKTKIYNINNRAEYENASQEVLEEVATGADVTKLLTMGMNAAIVGDTEGAMYVFEADNSRVPGLETTVKKSLVGAINSVYEEVQEKVNVEQGEANKNAIMITDSTGNVIPAPVGDCANTTNKCALVTGVDANGNLALQWEVIARNVPQPTAEE